MDKLNLSDDYISKKALTEYKKIVEKYKKEKDFLKEKKFQLEQIVYYKNSGYFDNIYGVGQIGKIVGYDFENDYYRVYFSEKNPYVGAKEEKLKCYIGNEELPMDIKNHKMYNHISLHFKL